MDEMLKVYNKDLAILRMERRGLIKQLQKNGEKIEQVNEYCNQILEGVRVYES
jgi:uncharacterized coiled-coil DUF342 family protein